ncbi:uncharacterized protein N7458_006810 [Penicillium daleae]|uniref:Uncharacterized protein n=1 Tax=Penicillium daleae TaxID=63821 RepID=A0AAD6C5A5_9EURO|nr:uncharacterized protein N7458_006810 [Penicillium daleae]KAJ5450361.1 hypothetical protein N7458_006810 [Penicillium daleae]
MIIAQNPEIQADPAKRPRVTRVSVVIHTPKRTGQPCPWSLWLQSEHISFVFELIQETQHPIILPPETMKQSREVIDCGGFPDRDFELGIELIASRPRDANVGSDTQEWVLGCLAQLTSRCSMELLSGVDTILGTKRTERPLGHEP